MFTLERLGILTVRRLTFWSLKTVLESKDTNHTIKYKLNCETKITPRLNLRGLHGDRRINNQQKHTFCALRVKNRKETGTVVHVRKRHCGWEILHNVYRLTNLRNQNRHQLASEDFTSQGKLTKQAIAVGFPIHQPFMKWVSVIQSSAFTITQFCQPETGKEVGLFWAGNRKESVVGERAPGGLIEIFRNATEVFW